VGQQGTITLLEQITIAKVIHRGAEPISAVHLGMSVTASEGATFSARCAPPRNE